MEDVTSYVVEETPYCSVALLYLNNNPNWVPCVINEELKKLEDRIKDLSDNCRRLEERNRMLQIDQRALNKENGRLAEKNRIACKRLETIVGRLKVLEKA